MLLLIFIFLWYLSLAEGLWSNLGLFFQYDWWFLEYPHYELVWFIEFAYPKSELSED